MSRKKIHAWRSSYHGRPEWNSWCGRRQTGEAGGYTDDGGAVGGATCLHCLKAYRDHKLWVAEYAAKDARFATDRLDTVARQDRRTK